MAAVERGRVLLIGAGGLGCAAALGLLAAGVRHLVVAESDSVAVHNLHRQLLYTSADVDRPKGTVMRERLLARGAQSVSLLPRLDGVSAIMGALQETQDICVVVDASDNFATRFAANDAAVAAGVPLVHGAATGWRGQVTTLQAGGRPCLRCLFGGPPEAAVENCTAAGVLGPLVLEIGGLMAREAAAVVGNQPPLLVGRMLTVDARTERRRAVSFPAAVGCTVCGTG